MNQPLPWWQNFFNGFILEFGNFYSEEQTSADADFLVETLAPAPGARFLDVPCGEGRIAHALGARGFHVTGVDFTETWLRKADRVARERNLPTDFVLRDMVELPWTAEFDYAYCFGNSFGYFPHEGNLDFLRGVQRVLKPGGKFVLQTNFCIESFHQQPLIQRWYQFGEMTFLHASKYDPPTGTLTSSYICIKDGKTERKQAVYQTYLYRDLVRMMGDAGFKNVSGYGSLKREPFQLGSVDLYLVVER
jgi:ubiquinone/menaquinone biosynthesis C-methylase UbiE